MTWTEEKNARRCDLIDKSIDDPKSMTDEEWQEYIQLQEEMIAHRNKVATLPHEEANQTLSELKQQAGLHSQTPTHNSFT